MKIIDGKETEVEILGKHVQYIVDNVDVLIRGKVNMVVRGKVSRRITQQVYRTLKDMINENH